jgi:hypothetical protein
MQIVISGVHILSVLIAAVFVFCVGTIGNQCRALRARLDDLTVSVARLEGRLASLSETRGKDQ